MPNLPYQVVLALATLALTSGCTSMKSASQTKMKYHDNTMSWEWTSPKDVKVDKLTIDPVTKVVTLEKLDAQVDAVAVTAAMQARLADTAAVKEATIKALEAAIIALKAAAKP